MYRENLGLHIVRPSLVVRTIAEPRGALRARAHRPLRACLSVGPSRPQRPDGLHRRLPSQSHFLLAASPLLPVGAQSLRLLQGILSRKLPLLLVLAHRSSAGASCGGIGGVGSRSVGGGSGVSAGAMAEDDLKVWVGRHSSLAHPSVIYAQAFLCFLL